MDIIKELVRVAREVVATIRKGDMYKIVDRDKYNFRGEVIVKEIKGNSIFVTEADSFTGTVFERDLDKFIEGIKNRSIVKVTKHEAPVKWDYYAWKRFVWQNSREVLRVFGPIVLRELKRNTSGVNVKHLKVEIVNDGIVPRDFTLDFYPKEEIFKGIKWTGELAPLNEIAHDTQTMQNLWFVVQPKFMQSISGLTDKKSVPLILDNQTVMGEFAGTFVKSRGGHDGERIGIKYVITNERDVVRQFRHVAEEGQLKAYIDLHRDTFFDKVLARVQDEEWTAGNVEWSWDGGQDGGWDDPSWDAYVDSVTYKDPANITLDWDVFFTDYDDETLELIGDEAAFYHKVLKNYGDLKLEDIKVDFDELGVQPCEITFRPIIKPDGIELDILNIDPGEDVLEKSAEEYDKGRNEPDYDPDDRY